MAETLPYRSLRPWLIESFGRPVHRVSLDAGSQCPNRDGTKGFGGCVYCDVEGSGTGALRQGQDLGEQLERGLARVARRDPGGGAIAYLQSYSNTYVDGDRLAEVLAVIEPYLDEGPGCEDPGREDPGHQDSGARPRNPVVAVSVATRPDTLPEAALDLLEALGRRVPVWVELGLESADDQVLLDINRLHTVDEFTDAVARCKRRGLITVGHAILGLPGDGRGGARRTAEVLAESGCEGVKVHQMMVLKKTVLEHWWREGRAEVLEAETYIEWLADFVERLAPEQVLHRLTGDAPLEVRLAPRWDITKHHIKQELIAELARRGTRQGSRFPSRV